MGTLQTLATWGGPQGEGVGDGVRGLTSWWRAGGDPRPRRCFSSDARRPGQLLPAGLLMWDQRGLGWSEEMRGARSPGGVTSGQGLCVVTWA